MIKSPDEIEHGLETTIRRAIDDNRIVGTVVIVALNGQVLYRKASGFLDREARRPMREDTIFRYASLTKPIVSAAALSLIDSGKMNLNDEVTRWIPAFNPHLANGQAPTIRIRHLLTHTSGLNYGFFEPDGQGPYHAHGVSDGLDHPHISLQENLKRLGNCPLLFAPGTEWRYSLATDVLGEVVSLAGGADLQAVVRNLITGPLKMNETEFWAIDPDRLAAPYADGNPKPLRMAVEHRLPFRGGIASFSPARALDKTAYPSAGAGMVGTADDFLKFLESLRQGGAPILKPETAQAMTSNQVGEIPVAARGQGWGFGFGCAVVTDPKTAKTPAQNGSFEWGGVYGNSWWVDPKAGLTVVALTNTAFEGMDGAFPKEIKAAVYGL